jgi:hypothetical protein
MKQILDRVFFAIVLVAVALLVDAWHSARHDSQQLASVVATQNVAIQQSEAREKQRDSQLATTLAAIQAQKRAVRTPSQASDRLAEVLPPLPLPVSIITPNLSVPGAAGTSSSGDVAASRSTTTSTSTPTNNSTSNSTSISIPQPDLIPLYDALQDCRASTAQIDSLQKDLSDEKSRTTALQRERDAAITAAHGGPFLTQLKRAAKWFAIGLLAGAAATVAAHR